MLFKNYPKTLIAILFLLAILNALAVVFSWYWRIPWLDMLTHTLGGVFIGGSFLWFVWTKKHSHKIHTIILQVILATILIGLLWEIFEFITDYIFKANSYDIVDGTSDLIFDILGGIIASVFFINKNNNLIKNDV